MTAAKERGLVRDGLHLLRGYNQARSKMTIGDERARCVRLVRDITELIDRLDRHPAGPVKAEPTSLEWRNAAAALRTVKRDVAGYEEKFVAETNLHNLVRRHDDAHDHR